MMTGIPMLKASVEMDAPTASGENASPPMPRLPKMRRALGGASRQINFNDWRSHSIAERGDAEERGVGIEHVQVLAAIGIFVVHLRERQILALAGEADVGGDGTDEMVLNLDLDGPLGRVLVDGRRSW
jgi:hypothetical protein